MKTLLMVLSLLVVFAVCSMAQPSPRVCFSDRECDEGYHCMSNYCMPDTQGSCPAACWCPGGGAPGCNPIQQFTSKSLMPDSVRLEILVASLYLKRPAVLLPHELAGFVKQEALALLR